MRCLDLTTNLPLKPKYDTVRTYYNSFDKNKYDDSIKLDTIGCTYDYLLDY